MKINKTSAAAAAAAAAALDLFKVRRHARCFRASVHFICAGERADARRYALRGTVGGVTATRPIAPNGFERMHTPARRRGGTIGWPQLCPAQHLFRTET